ncbi:carbohydrate ABC transporter permease [Paenibacillus alkaliterrae]|uniref:carbohydrate ABC transporter permease n=1 Tax=Paenibacillus alkaliterrae TaxID=320909 RepID=UPI001F1B787E|nr:carbohydrate ABC transporter permease [Paenibacillus alkaliterrae]MCF2936947.1 carbohydrate ABC transporter permease [Paenibacillus alkaliterrae]
MKLSPFRLLIYAFSVLCSLVFLYPLLFSFQNSLKDNTEIYSENLFALPAQWLWSNYKRAIVEGHMDWAVLNSFLYAAAGTVLALILGLMASFVLSRIKFKFREAIYLYFITGLMIPVFSLMIPISRLIGTVNGFNNYVVLIVLYAVIELPFTIFLITGFMRGISKEIDESAVIDGCKPGTLLFRILLPLTMPAVSTAGILAFFSIYNDLIWNVLLISDRSLFNISIALMSFVGQYGSVQMGPTFASIMITIIPTIIVYLLFQEKVENGLSAGAVKE